MVMILVTGVVLLESPRPCRDCRRRSCPPAGWSVDRRRPAPPIPSRCGPKRPDTSRGGSAPPPMIRAAVRADTWLMSSPGFTPSRRRLTALRLAAQRIGSGGFSTPVETVRWMLALQAQDFPGVKWSVGLRQAGATEAAVEAAFDAGEIVRSWPLRGTLHLVPAEDLGLAAGAHRTAVDRLGGRTAGRSRAHGGRRGARRRDRAFRPGRPSGPDPRRAARDVRGRLVSAPPASVAITCCGTSPRPARSSWARPMVGSRPSRCSMNGCRTRGGWSGDEALGELALRYYRSHGPATAADLARWAGLTVE